VAIARALAAVGVQEGECGSCWMTCRLSETDSLLASRTCARYCFDDGRVAELGRRSRLFRRGGLAGRMERSPGPGFGPCSCGG
jgi:hypothetical protein